MKLHHRIGSHLKKHHKKYLFGVFGSFAIVKMLLLFAGFFGIIQHSRTFAQVPVELNSGNITEAPYSCATDATICDLDNKGITSIAPNTFINHHALHQLGLRSNQITSIQAGTFDGLSGLVYLFLESNQLTTIQAGIFSGLSALQNLYLNDNQITNIQVESFHGLSSLSSLQLPGNQLTGIQAGTFDGLSALYELNLGSNQITSIQAGTFDGLSVLEYVYLGTNQLTELQSDIFSGLSALARLELDNNQITSIQVGAFNGLSSLRALKLDTNQLTGIQVGAFNGLTNLRDINLNNNQLTSIQAGTFDGLSSLEYVYLNNNQLTSIQTGTFDGFSSLTRIYLDNNLLSTLPESITGNTALSYIGLSGNCRDTGAMSSALINFLNTKYEIFDMFQPQNNQNGTGWQTAINPACPAPVVSISGCMDATANNYTAAATTDDGSCTYASGIVNNTTITETPYNCATGATLCDLTNKGITSIAPNTFIDHNALTTLFLSNNQLTGIQVGAFNGLINLTALLSSNNQISSIESGAFNGLTNLTALLLSNNQISSIGSGAFNGILNSIIRLELGNNQISSIESGDFNGLSSLEILNLSNNQIGGFLASTVFDGLAQLHSLDLSYNTLTGMNISGLTNLTLFKINDNLLTSLPEGLTGLGLLSDGTGLDISYNYINYTPFSISTVGFIDAKSAISDWRSTQIFCGNGIPEGDELCDDGIDNGKRGYCNLSCTEVLPADTDGDGVPDTIDNCPNTSNTDQVDTNGDSIGDACQLLDPLLPTATVEYSIPGPTNQDVIATLTGWSEEITGVNAYQHTFTGNGDFIFTFTSLSGFEGNVIATVDWIDKESPVITISGATTIDIEWGTVYTDAGATARDSLDGDITANMSSSGTVDTHTIGNYIIEYMVTDSVGNEAYPIRIVNVVDTTAPVITLLGNSPITIQGGSEYTDAGATAEDAVNGNLTDSIITGGTVDTSRTGTYMILYTVSDTAGNIGTGTRTVHVVDTIAPVITLIGDSIVTGEYGAYYHDLGATARDSFDGDLTNIENDTVNVYVVGEQTITYTVSDAAGNIGTGTRTVHIVDTTAPVITLIGEENTIVEYGTEYTDAGATRTDTHDGTGHLASTSGLVQTDKVGTYTLEYLKADSFGNTDKIIRTITIEDTIAPTATISYNIEGWTNHDVVATVTGFSEAVTGINTATHTFTGNGTFTFTFFDVNGNTGSREASVVNIDKEKPIINMIGSGELTIEYGTQYYEAGASAQDNVDDTDLITLRIEITSNVDTGMVGDYYQVVYEVADTAGNTGIATRIVHVVDTTAPLMTLGEPSIDIIQGTVYIDSGATAEDNVDGDITANIITGGAVDTSRTGTYIITYDVNDHAGNAATQLIRYVTVLQKGAPTATIAYSSETSTNQNVIATLTGFSEAVTGINAATHTFTGNGIFTFTFSDLYGNLGSRVASVSNIDKEKPTITMIGSGEVTIEYGAQYYEAGASAEDNVDGAITISISGTVDTGALGTYTLYYDVEDAAGNAATQVTRTVYVVDTTAPVITLIGNQTGYITQGQTYIDSGANASDNVSGNITSSIIRSGTVNTSRTGTYILTYNVSDSSHNAANEIRRYVIVQQKSAPTATISYNITGWTNHDIIATVTGFSEAVTGKNATGYIFTGNGSFAFTFSDLYGNPGRATGSVTWIDKVKPVVTIIGSGSIDIEYKTVYTESGATASDNLSGNITSSIIRSGTVNTGAVGTYTITYNVSDIAGNTGSATRTVRVVDTTAPVITLSGNNTIYVEFGSGYTEVGATASDNVSGNITSSIIRSGTVNTGILGSYPITYTVTDVAGNTATPVMRTVIVRDTTAPVITLIGSGTIHIEYANVYSESGARWSDIHDGSGLVASISGHVDTLTPGTYTLLYSKTDISGNTGTASRIVKVGMISTILSGEINTTGSAMFEGATTTGVILSGTGTLTLSSEETGNNSLEIPSNIGAINASGTRDGTISAPETDLSGQATQSELYGFLPSSTSNTTYTHDIITTVKVGSNVPLRPTTGYFTVTIHVVGYNGQTIKVFRSEDGNNRTKNAPDETCTVTGNICTFRTDHLSFFAPAKVVAVTAVPAVNTVTVGGGGGTTLIKDDCPGQRDCSDSYYDKLCGACPSSATGHGAASTKVPASIANSPYSSQSNQAYLRAYSYDITTMPTIQNANIDGKLMRRDMAKMITNFATQVMGMKITAQSGLNCRFSDIASLGKQTQYYILYACRLGLMGYENDGVTVQKKFDPNKEVDRRQFGTILSRVIRGTKYNGGTLYYTNHLAALKRNAIMTKIDTPTQKEIRGFVMLMMKRAFEMK